MMSPDGTQKPRDEVYGLASGPCACGSTHSPLQAGLYRSLLLLAIGGHACTKV